MDGKAPVGGGAERGEPGLLLLQRICIGVADAFDTGDEGIGFALEALEADATRVGEERLGRVKDLEKIASDGDGGHRGDHGADLRQRMQEVANEDHACMPGNGKERGHAVARRKLGDAFCKVFQGEAASAEAGWSAEQADSLTAAEQEGSEGEKEKIGPLALVGSGGTGAPIHAAGAVTPEIDGLGGFPLGFADEGAVGFGRGTPVDPGDRVALIEWAELPKAITLSDSAAAMHALGDRIGNALGGDEKRREAGAEGFSAAGALVGGSVQTAWPMSVSMTSGRPTPSARAEKLSAMR